MDRPEASRAAWLSVALATAVAPMSIGLSRFGYSLLLPAMRRDLGWTFAQAGTLNTANGLGFLVGALLAPAAARALGERRALIVACALAAASLAGAALAQHEASFLALRATTGLTSGVLYVLGATAATRLADRSPSPGLILGLYFGGVGPGILVSALLTPLALGVPSHWRAAWLAMGAVVAAGSAALARTVPAFDTPRAPRAVPLPWPRLAWGLAAFTLYGVGYGAYMTFVVAYYVAAGTRPWAVTAFWTTLALAATASAFAWRGTLERGAAGRGLGRAILLVGAGAGLPLVSRDAVAMLASGLLFGGAFLAVSTAMAQLVRDALPAGHRAAGLALPTVLFGLGQALGPALGGVLADRTGGPAGALALATAVLIGGSLAARGQGRGPGRSSDPPPPRVAAAGQAGPGGAGAGAGVGMPRGTLNTPGGEAPPAPRSAPVPQFRTGRSPETMNTTHSAKMAT